MSKFVFEKKEITVEAYGQMYILPSKTPKLMEQMSAVSVALSGTQRPTEQAKAVLGGVAAIIGAEEASRLFPVFDEIDTDEMSALWMTLSGEYEKRAKEVLAQYAPERLER